MSCGNQSGVFGRVSLRGSPGTSLRNIALPGCRVRLEARGNSVLLVTVVKNMVIDHAAETRTGYTWHQVEVYSSP